MKEILDPTLLQRLVDGECSSVDVRSILLAAQRDPAAWQQIAVAVLEDRAWQCQLLPRPESVPQLGDAGLVQPESSAAGPMDLASATPANQAATTVSPIVSSAATAGGGLGFSHFSSPRLLNWLAMAASLVAVSVLSYSIGQHQTGQRGSGLIANSTPSVQPPARLADNPPRTLASLQPDYRMQLPAHDPAAGGRLQPSGDVPMYLIKSLDQWQELDRPQRLQLTPEDLAELNARGIGVQKDFNVISGKLDDGRVFVVPIRSIRFAPWQ